MKISMHAYCFNGKTFMVAVHECLRGEDYRDHPISLAGEFEEQIAGGHKAYRRDYMPGSVEDKAFRALKIINGVTSADFMNNILLIIISTSWDELESEVKRALEDASKPDFIDRFSALAQAAFGPIEVEERIELGEPKSYRNRKYDDLSVAEPIKNFESYRSTEDKYPPAKLNHEPTDPHRFRMREDHPFAEGIMDPSYRTRPIGATSYLQEEPSPEVIKGGFVEDPHPISGI
jgi:hypothetical protein